MSLRDVKEYYYQIENQYFEMNQSAKELNEECAKGNITQQMVDQAEAMVLPLKQNYERLSYILFLFNKPNRPRKRARYEKETKTWGSFFKNTEKETIDESADALKRFKEYVNSLKGERQ